MWKLLIVTGLAVACARPARGAGLCPHPHRSRAARAAFVRTHPCPGGPDLGSTRRCRGYVVDHVVPLACCGADTPTNMQWQTVREARAKDRWERRCGEVRG